MSIQLGLNMYSVDHFARTDFKSTVVKMKEIGYTAIELTAFYSFQPNEIQKFVKRTGLSIPTVHATLQYDKHSVKSDFERSAKTVASMGIKHIVVPFLPVRNELSNDELLFLQQLLKELVAIAEKHKLTLVLHNDSREFNTLSDNVQKAIQSSEGSQDGNSNQDEKNNQDGRGNQNGIKNQVGQSVGIQAGFLTPAGIGRGGMLNQGEKKNRLIIDYLLEPYSYDQVQLELDLYSIYISGLNPFEIYERYEQRTAFVHLRNVKEGRKECLLKEGVIDYKYHLNKMTNIHSKMLYIEQQSGEEKQLEFAQQNYSFIAELLKQSNVT